MRPITIHAISLTLQMMQMKMPKAGDSPNRDIPNTKPPSCPPSCMGKNPSRFDIMVATVRMKTDCR